MTENYIELHSLKFTFFRHTAINWKANGNASDNAMIMFAEDRLATSTGGEEGEGKTGDKGNDAKDGGGGRGGGGGAAEAAGGEQATNVDHLRNQYPRVARLPFNSRNKFKCTVHRQPDAAAPLLVTMSGAAERVINRAGRANVDGNIVPVTDKLRAQLFDQLDQMVGAGLRVLGLAETEISPDLLPNASGDEETNLELEEGRLPWEGTGLPLRNGAWDAADTTDPALKPCFLGLVGMIDPCRAGMVETIQELKECGAKVIMVTGDHPSTASATAKDAGIFTQETSADCCKHNEDKGLKDGDEEFKDPALAGATVVSGTDIGMRGVSVPVFKNWLQHELVFARVSPSQKALIIAQIRAANPDRDGGSAIVFVGDGINDAPAVKCSDVGISLASGANLTRLNADMVLCDDNIRSVAAIVTAVRGGVGRGGVGGGGGRGRGCGGCG